MGKVGQVVYILTDDVLLHASTVEAGVFVRTHAIFVFEARSSFAQMTLRLQKKEKCASYYDFWTPAASPAANCNHGSARAERRTIYPSPYHGRLIQAWASVMFSAGMLTPGVINVTCTLLAARCCRRR
jgi:hypothetical protein